MHILSRHLINEFLKTFFLALAGFVCIFIIIDFFEKIDNFMEAEVSWDITLAYFLFQLPLVIQQMLPAAILLGTIITLSLMARNRELIILRSSGVSLLRISYPLILLSFCFTLLLFFLNEAVLPQAHEAVNRIWQVEVQKNPLKAFFRNEKIWYRGKQVIYHIDYYDQNTAAIHGITIYRFSPDFVMLERIDATKAQWTGSQWVFYDGIIQKKSGDGSYNTNRFQEARLDIPEMPEDFGQMVRRPDEMNLRALQDYIAKTKKEGYDATKLGVDLQGRIAFPFVCIIMTLVGIPLSLRSEKKGGIASGVGLGVSVAFLFWILYSISLTLGKTGAFPPLMAGWLTNFLFFSGGILLLITIRQ